MIDLILFGLICLLIIVVAGQQHKIENIEKENVRWRENFSKEVKQYIDSKNFA